LTINLSIYISLLYFFRLFVFTYRGIYKYLLGLLEAYYSKNFLYSNKRAYFLIINSFNYLSLIL
ncbi:uncharacterized protein K444DRAFT_518098, partial [Hyaloscypha bicolor E]